MSGLYIYKCYSIIIQFKNRRGLSEKCDLTLKLIRPRSKFGTGKSHGSKIMLQVTIITSLFINQITRFVTMQNFITHRVVKLKVKYDKYSYDVVQF